MMNDEDIKNKIAKDLAYRISPMKEELLKFFDQNNLEIDENGELIPKKKTKFTLFLKKRNKHE